jgi:hypothetical protein
VQHRQAVEPAPVAVRPDLELRRADAQQRPAQPRWQRALDRDAVDLDLTLERPESERPAGTGAAGGGSGDRGGRSRLPTTPGVDTGARRPTNRDTTEQQRRLEAAMHALPSHPGSPLVAGLIALALAMLAMLAAAPELGSLDFSIGGGEVVTTDAPAPAPPVTADPAAPTWVTDPVAAPIEAFAR